MTEKERDRLIAELIARPQDRNQLLAEESLDTDDRDAIVRLVQTADLLWLAAQEPPPIEQDPMAVLLGLVPDPDRELHAGRLTQTRRRANLKVGEVAARLRSRGWSIQARDVLAWETHSTADVTPALVQALADVLGVAPSHLLEVVSDRNLDNELALLRQDPGFDTLVARWSQARHTTTAVAKAELERRALVSVHRGDRPTHDQVLRSLEALISAVENAAEE